MAALLELGELIGEGLGVAAEDAVVVGEGVAEDAAVMAEGVAAKVAVAEELAAEAAAAEEAAESAATESEAGLEDIITKEEKAIEAEEAVAEAEAGIGSRIVKAVREKILAGLKGVLKLIKVLAKNAMPLLLLKTGIDQVPKEHRKELAGLAMILAAGGNKLALVAYAYIKLTGGSEEGKTVAKDAHNIVKDLHEKALNLKIDTPSKEPIDEQLMKKIKERKDSTKKDIVKVKVALDQINDLLEEHAHDKPIEEEEGEEKEIDIW